MVSTLKKILFAVFLLSIFIWFWSSKCEDCTKSTLYTVKAVNLTESDVKKISQQMFTADLYLTLDKVFPKYVGTFEEKRIAYKVRTKVNTNENVSKTQFKIGFKYTGFEEKEDPSIVNDAELVSKFLVEKLSQIVTIHTCEENIHELCNS